MADAAYRQLNLLSINAYATFYFDDDSVFPTIVFASGERVFGCADFTSLPGAMVLDYVQGMSAATAREQRTIWGRPWFEVFMGRLIESYSRLHDLGVGLMLRVEPHYRLPRMVRDRYFERQPTMAGSLHALASDRERVRKNLVREKADGPAMTE